MWALCGIGSTHEKAEIATNTAIEHMPGVSCKNPLNHTNSFNSIIYDDLMFYKTNLTVKHHRFGTFTLSMFSLNEVMKSRNECLYI